MKTLVSYVLQDEKGHEHRSEVLDFKRTSIHIFIRSTGSSSDDMGGKKSRPNYLMKGD